MARFVVGMNVSLDGYVDHTGFAPGPKLFDYFVEQVAGLAGSIYGRRMYEIMRYWDEEQAGWGPAHRAFAAAWCGQPKWVVSHTLTSVGPNATLVSDDVDGTLRRLKDELDGDVDVSGTILVQRVAELGLVDMYRLFLHPVVLGQGTPFFAGPRPRLHLSDMTQMDEDVVRLTYVPA